MTALAVRQSGGRSRCFYFSFLNTFLTFMLAFFACLDVREPPLATLANSLARLRSCFRIAFKDFLVCRSSLLNMLLSLCVGSPCQAR